jgi:hypothetical protein
MWVILGKVSLSASIVGGIVALCNRIKGDIEEKKTERFIKARAKIKCSRHELTAKVIKHYSLDEENILLYPADYCFPVPIRLDNVKLELIADDSSQEIIDFYTKRFRRFWPNKEKTYSKAVQWLEKPDPDKFYDGLSYRLIRIDQDGECLKMTFSLASYFQYFNTGEALVFTEALQVKSNSNSKYRKYFPKTLDFKKHIFTPGIQTLSIRLSKDRKSAQFYFLSRDLDKVAAAGGLLCLLPAGEFQPATRDSDEILDLSLWRNIMRESVEEFLNREINLKVEDKYDYSEFPFPELIEAKEDGKIAVWLLGYGACPLNYKLDFLTACIYSANTFDKIFGEYKAGKPNAEGTIYAKPIPFTRNEISSYLNINRTATTAVACLKLAYKHREKLGIPCVDDPETILDIKINYDRYAK